MSRKRIELSNDDTIKIQSLAEKGLGVREIAACLGMSKATLERRLNENTEAFEALEVGRAKCDAEIISTAYNLAKSGKNVNLLMFWLKTRCGWNEELAQNTVEVNLCYSLE
jgi:IS30 family transposase